MILSLFLHEKNSNINAYEHYTIKVFLRVKQGWYREKGIFSRCWCLLLAGESLNRKKEEVSKRIVKSFDTRRKVDISVFRKFIDVAK